MLAATDAPPLVLSAADSEDSCDVSLVVDVDDVATNAGDPPCCVSCDALRNASLRCTRASNRRPTNTIVQEGPWRSDILGALVGARMLLLMVYGACFLDSTQLEFN